MIHGIRRIAGLLLIGNATKEKFVSWSLLKPDDRTANLVSCKTGVSRAKSGRTLCDSCNNKQVTPENTVGNFKVVVVGNFMNGKQPLPVYLPVPHEIIIVARCCQLLITRRNGGRRFSRDRVFSDGVLLQPGKCLQGLRTRGVRQQSKEEKGKDSHA